MPVLNRDALREQLKRREFAPVYLLFGPEVQLRDRAAKAIADLAFDGDDLRDFNDTTFSLNSDGGVERALAAAEQLPMMSKRRVVRVTDVRVSMTGIRDTIREEHEAILTAYLERPAPETILVMVADELNGVRKIGKFLRERTTAVEFTQLDDRAMYEIAKPELRRSGIEIDEMTLRYLIGRIGPDVNRLTNEINKLAAAALPNGRVTIDMIDSLVANTRELSNFDLTDHLVAGRRSKALATLRKVLDDGAEPVALVGLLAANYRKMLMAKDMMDRGSDRGEVIRAMNIRGRSQEAMIAAAIRADTRKLINAISKLARTDLAIKTSKGGSGPAAARMQLEMLVCELALDQIGDSSAARLK